jgi:branched-chain amino acid transport system ATP-binding protein
MFRAASSPAAAPPLPPEGAVLTVESVSSGYGDLIVLRDVSLSLRPGQIELLVGRNGAGKSTLVGTIAGLRPTMHGRVRLGNSDITRMAPHNRVRAGLATVLEGRRLFSKRSVRDNLNLGAYSRRPGKAVLAEELSKVVELLPRLEPLLSRTAGSLSGGEQQMVAIGQALMADPKVLLLDEPSAGLAPAIINQLLEIIVSLRDQGRAILLVEQIVDKVIDYADNVTVMSSGRIVMHGTREAMTGVDVLREVYFGRDHAQR